MPKTGAYPENRTHSRGPVIGRRLSFDSVNEAGARFTAMRRKPYRGPRRGAGLAVEGRGTRVSSASGGSSAGSSPCLMRLMTRAVRFLASPVEAGSRTTPPSPGLLKKPPLSGGKSDAPDERFFNSPSSVGFNPKISINSDKFTGFFGKLPTNFRGEMRGIAGMRAGENPPPQKRREHTTALQAGAQRQMRGTAGV